MRQLYLLYFLVLSLLCSCVSTRHLTNFNNVSDTTITYQIQSIEPVIQKNDILSISVNSLNKEASQPFNLYTTSNNIGNAISGTISQTSGYLVDQDGNIEFPALGVIQVAGLNKKQLKQKLEQALREKQLLYDPVVNIRYLNYKVTVLGEVNNPSVFNVPSEKITLLEALGMAGDLTPFAKRDNVLLIQDLENGERKTHRINLNDDGLFTSPHYYLKSNDVVYVAPNRARAANSSAGRQWLPAVISGMSFILILVDRIVRN